MIIRSSIALDYIKQANQLNNFHVELALGEVKAMEPDLPDVIYRNYENFEMACSAQDFYMMIKDIGLFSILGRKKAFIQLNKDVSVERALPYFYGTVLTVLLHMHMRFPLHASAVLSKKGLNLFCAASGTGKSTLAFQLFQRGYPLFSDDKCILKWDPILKKFLSQPAIRVVRLWQDAIDHIDNPEVLSRGLPVIYKQDKYQFNLDDEMYDRLHMIHRIFVIHKLAELEKPTIHLVRGKRKIQVIRNQIHRPGMIVGEDMKKRFENFTTSVARLIPVFLVRRPADIPIPEFVDFMAERIGEPVQGE